MKKYALIILVATLCLGFIATRPVIYVAVAYKFDLPIGEYVSSTSEQALQHEASVVFDSEKAVYMLERRGKKVYRLKRNMLPQTINLASSSKFRQLSNSAISSANGDLWSLSSRTVRLFSHSGELIREWQVDNLDVGYFQGLKNKSAIIDGGGPIFFYKSDRKTPQLLKKKSLGVFQSFIDWNGNQWAIQEKNKGIYFIEHQNLLLPFPSTEGKTTAFQFESKSDLSGAWLFWHQQPNNSYIRKKLFNQTGQDSIFYRADKTGLHEIVRLKEKNDPLLAHIGPNITINRPLWGQGNSVVVYAYEAQDKNNPRPQKQYILQFSRVPRWKSWFSS